VIGGWDVGRCVELWGWLIAVIDIGFIHIKVKYDQTMLQNE